MHRDGVKIRPIKCTEFSGREVLDAITSVYMSVLLPRSPPRSHFIANSTRARTVLPPSLYPACLVT